jgi:hypothetical protein
MVTLAGLDPIRYLREKDPEMRSVLAAIAVAADTMRKYERIDLVVRIVKALNNDKSYVN